MAAEQKNALEWFWSIEDGKPVKGDVQIDGAHSVFRFGNTKVESVWAGDPSDTKGRYEQDARLIREQGYAPREEMPAVPATQEAAVFRIALALESIAQSLVLMSHPMVKADGAAVAPENGDG